MPILTTTQIIGIGVTAASILLKSWATKLYTAWVNDSPNVEAFLIKITFNQYRKKARARKALDLFEAKKKANNDEVNRKIDSLLQTLGDTLGLNRVTVSVYKYTGLLPFPDNPTEQDFANFEVTITNEWKDDNVQPIMNDWQGVSAAMFAKTLYLLHTNPDGYITIGPTDSDDLQLLQNLYGVDKSWQFSLRKGILDGVLVLSIFEGYYHGQELHQKHLREVKKTTTKIYVEKLKLIP